MVGEQLDSSGGTAEDTVETRGTVKWFDTAKGYGFIVPDDGSADVLLHHSVLQDTGRRSLPEGTVVECEAVHRQKGLQVIRVLNFDTSNAVAETAIHPVHRARHYRVPEAQGEFMDATVKWFNRARGYGFISQGEESQDIFIHMEVLRRNGIDDMLPGQAVRVRIGDTEKGPQVVDIEIVAGDN